MFGQLYTTDVVLTGEGAQFVQFIFGVLGAVMFGWMVLLGAVVLGPFRRGERWSWIAVSVSIVAWFAIDSVFDCRWFLAECPV